MNNELKMSYETMGSSSYMTVTCPPEVKLVNYELEMMLSNDIENFLTVSKQVLDGETVLYYNITSRIPLRQVLDKRKLNRKELFNLIEGAILAGRDATAYRLPSAGIVLEAEYIYVNPASCAPAFMFLPLQDPKGAGIREMLSDLVLHDRIELSGDNFIQVLLVELNRQPFSIEQLEKSLKPYRVSQRDMQGYSTNAGVRQAEHSIPIGRLPINSGLAGQQPARFAPMDQPQSTGLGSKEPQPAGMESVKPQPTAPALTKHKEPEKVKRAEKKKFMVVQVFAIAAVVAGIFGGLFTDEDGGILLNNILAFMIAFAVAEIILYREIFVNSRKKAVGNKTAHQQRTAEAKVPPQTGIQAHSRRPVPPLASSQTASPHTVSSQFSPQPPVSPQTGSRPPVSPQTGSQPPVSPQSIPNQIYGHQMMPQYLLDDEIDDTDVEDETELWNGEGENGIPAYLEYYENGMLNRIPLNSLNDVVIGRLKQQVDFAVKSPRVGKVHARFFCENGQYYVVDINSKNGTYINGSGIRIESNIPFPLHDKDRIMLADSEFTIRCSGE